MFVWKYKALNIRLSDNIFSGIQGSHIISFSGNTKRSYIEDIQIFGINMPFISSSEAKNAYFISGEATNEIYIFSLHEMK